MKKEFSAGTDAQSSTTADNSTSASVAASPMLAEVSDKKGCLKSLIEKRFYNPYDVFQHPPEFYSCDDDKYTYKIHCVKWNTRSTRMTVLFARFDERKGWIFSKKTGLRRTPHGEKMR